jgi:hypothetical protein
MVFRAFNFVMFFLLMPHADAGENSTADKTPRWQVDFQDDFESFNADNWQDQILWVNNEDQCYVPDNLYNTREVSAGTLKVRVVNIGEERPCNNMDKTGKIHPDTRYVAARIASKNRKEFVKGKWTARLRTWGNGQDGMFPAWWLLGAQNNETPVQEPDENVCWPMAGSGEIDIFEHHSDGGAGHGDDFEEPLFAILNYAKIIDAPMQGEWVMEIDWVKHEYRHD